MKIYLAAIEDELYDAFEEVVRPFRSLDIGHDVILHKGNILSIDDIDAVVSPANSFGFMDDGIDAAYCEYFGAELEQRVVKTIKLRGHEIPVGGAEVFGTQLDYDIKYIIVAPTMRIPQKLPVDTINPYLATAAALHTARTARHVRIKSIAFPGMGTGIGGVPPLRAAKQMMHAIVGIKWPKHWVDARDLDREQRA